MPTVALEVPETYNSISRPIAINLVRDLIERFRLPSDTRVVYTGAADTIANQGSTLASKNKDVLFPFEGKVNLEVQEEYLEDGVLTTAIKRHDNNPIFQDRDIGVKMFPVYTKTQTVLTFTYSCNSRREAESARDRLRRKSSEGMESLIHELVYHYSPPPVFHQILKEIHSKREAVGGYGEDYFTWLNNNYVEGLSVLSNLDGKNGLPVIGERQILVQGWFDFEGQPDPAEVVQDGGRWELTFSYTIQYDKVTAMILKYPIIVHNQLLNKKYIPTSEVYDPYLELRNPSYSGRNFEAFSKINYSLDSPYRGFIIPENDDWVIPNLSNKLITIFTALVGVELKDPYQIVNLRQLGKLSINDDILQYILKNRVNITNYLSNVFLVTLYKDNSPQIGTGIYIDDELNVRSNVKLDLRDVHHITLSVVTDLRLLRKSAVETMLNDPAITFKIIDMLEKLLGSKNVITSTTTPRPRVGQAYDTNSRSKLPRYNKNLKKQANVIYPFDNNSPNAKDSNTLGASSNNSNTRAFEIYGEKGLTDYLKVIGDRLITRASFEEVLARINTGVDLALIGQGRGLKTVMQANILSHKLMRQ